MTGKTDYYRLIKAFQLLIVLIIFMAPVKSHAAFDGAAGFFEVLSGYEITGANCDVTASPKDDAGKTSPNLSCKGAGVSLDSTSNFAGFRVNIVDTNDSSNTHSIGLGERITLSETLSSTVLSLRRESDMACLYGKRKQVGLFSIFGEQIVLRDDSESFSFAVFIPLIPLMQGVSDLKYKRHCVYLPVPDITPRPNDEWSNIISEVCTTHDSSATNFRFADGASRAFSGIVIQCIEETMNNLLIKKDGNDVSYFSIMQDKFKEIIFILLVLYVVFFGYKAIIEAQVTSSPEFIWFFLKAGLVIYFAAGSGAIDIYPKVQTFTKDMSAIVLESAMGVKFISSGNDPANIDNRRDFINIRDAKKDELDAAREELIAIRREIATIQADLIITPGDSAMTEALNKALEDRDIEQSEYDAILEEYQFAVSGANSFGYNYCNFSNFEYPPGAGYIKIWDILDCRMAKYLGVGDYRIDNEDGTYRFHQKHPQVIAVGISTVFGGSGVGPLIFIMTMIFIIYLVLVILRIVTIYIAASVGLTILFYISPLIIPAVLFEYTKDAFKSWMTQVISFVVQPIMLFTFVAFLFSAYDMVIFSGNYQFVPATTEHNQNENRICMKKTSTGEDICTSAEFEAVSIDELECYDKDSPGCIYQSILVKDHTIWYTSSMSNAQAYLLLKWLIVLIAVSFIGHSALQMIEQMAKNMTNAVLAASSMAIAPSKDPASAANALSAAARSPAKLGKGTYEGGKKLNAARKSVVSGAKSVNRVRKRVFSRGKKK